MITVRATLRAISSVDGTATVQLVGAGSLRTFVRGLDVSSAIPAGDLAPGADVWVEIVDRFRSSDGQVIGLAGVSSSTAAPAGGGTPVTTQSGSVIVSLNGVGHGTATVTFSPAFGAAPQVTVSVKLGSGSAAASAIGAGSFLVTVSGGPVNRGTVVAWSATGS